MSSTRCGEALSLLNESAGTVTAASSLYSTAPMGTEAGTGYRRCRRGSILGLVAIGPAGDHAAGRTGMRPGAARSLGPRTLDIDLLLAGPTVVQTPTLTIPHPGLSYRRFALDPLVELARPQLHPLWNMPLVEIQAALRQRPLPLAIRRSPLGRRALLDGLPESLRRRDRPAAGGRRRSPVREFG